MKSSIHYKILPEFKLMVEEGQEIDSDIIIAEYRQDQEKETIPIARLLKVDPSKITKYLQKKVSDEIKQGEVIARKKGIFSTFWVKSPRAGKITSLDLKKGTLTVTFKKSDHEEKKHLSLPVKGKINHIAKEYIEIEIEGTIYNAIKGQGYDALGKLFFLEADPVGILDIPDEVDKNVFAGSRISADAQTKLYVLGCAGLILKKIQQINADLLLPWVQLGDDAFENIAKIHHKSVWLRPKEKQLVIID